MIELEDRYGPFVRIGEKYWIDFSKMGAFHIDNWNNVEVIVDKCKVIISADDVKDFFKKLEEHYD